MVSRPMTEIDSVNGMPLGQTCTQFCALPQSEMPPSPMRASRRAPACISTRRVHVVERTREIT
jgi:hypothetical protein